MTQGARPVARSLQHARLKDTDRLFCGAGIKARRAGRRAYTLACRRICLARASFSGLVLLGGAVA